LIILARIVSSKKGLTGLYYSYTILPNKQSGLPDSSQSSQGENMPQRRAAKKDLRQNKKRKAKNLIIKQSLKAAVKKLKKSLEEKDSKARSELLRQVCKLLDKAAAKNIIHKNKAAKRKSRLSKLLKTPSKKTTASKKKSQKS